MGFGGLMLAAVAVLAVLAFRAAWSLTGRHPVAASMAAGLALALRGAQLLSWGHAGGRASVAGFLVGSLALQLPLTLGWGFRIVPMAWRRMARRGGGGGAGGGRAP